MQKTIKSFDGTKINYEISREKNKNSHLIFIHGVAADLKMWENLRKFFHKKGISTLAVDLRGYGKSGKPKSLNEYDLKNFAKDIKEILQREDISNPILIGHSLGGMILLTFHRLYPKIARLYVIISSSYEAPKLLKSIRKNILMFANILNKRLDSTIFTNIKGNSFEGVNWNFGNNNPLKIIPEMINRSVNPLIFTLENIHKFNEKRILNKIEKPVLILSGGNDFIINASNSKKLNKLIKKSKLKIFPKKSHLLISEIPEEIGEEIYSFMKSSELS